MKTHMEFQLLMCYFMCVFQVQSQVTQTQSISSGTSFLYQHSVMGDHGNSPENRQTLRKLYHYLEKGKFDILIFSRNATC